MAEIIASTYEVLKKIGEGGGGVVYLANHLRLNKLVVLKADKRDLNARPESLSREVSLLKNLNHTYIPQVYDYFTENGIVYTVIDFIDGESLDKPLKRGDYFSQPQIVEWACEILEALVYLHGQTPGILHADIKPSNIMVTPKGDIRLIDFNISLLLKESGAVRVGFSWGYASPEHYGVDYRDPKKSDRKRQKDSGREKTVPMPGSKEQTEPLNNVESKTLPLSSGSDFGKKTTVLLGDRKPVPADSAQSMGSSGDQHRERTILLDVRSDIYSLGATLYHLISGVRPANDAKEVVPLHSEGISTELCRIINKAMAPDPDDRYQTAKEMLFDLEHLHEHDPRSKRLRRLRSAVSLVFVFAFLCGGALSLLGLQQAKRIENARVLAGQSQEALRRGDPVLASQLAASALPEKLSLLDPVYVPEAQSALAEALGVYDLSDGFKAKEQLALSKEALKVALSPNGSRLCAICAWELAIFDTANGEKLAVLPVEESALSSAVFLDDNRIAYSGPGALRIYDIDQRQELWQGKASTGIAVSADGNRIAAVYKDASEADIYEAATGELLKTLSFGGRHQSVAFNDAFVDPMDNLFSLNADGSMLAMSFADGGVYISDLNTDEVIAIILSSDFSHFEGGFSGKYLAFSGYGGGESVLMIVDLESMSFVLNTTGITQFRVRTDENGIYAAGSNQLIKINVEGGPDQELAYVEKPILTFCHSGDHTIVATEDKHFAFYHRGAGEMTLDSVLTDLSCNLVDLAGDVAVVGSMDSPTLRLLRLEGHSKTKIITYDPFYLHSEARLSADGKTVTLFRNDRFRVYTIDGKLLSDMRLPTPEQVYDQQFRRNNGESYLEVIWYDGTVRRYSAADGSLISTEQGVVPDESLYEEFFTLRYRIASPLHGTPIVYDRETGELVKELEKEAYMTYATEVGDYIITEYVTVQGERYGLLLNQELETLAVLPNLCDVIDGRLVFDYDSGELRETKIHTLQELLTLAGRQ